MPIWCSPYHPSEAAEMPGMYGEDDYDWLRFYVWCCEKSQIIDRFKSARGCDSWTLSGILNGYSLVRRVFGLHQVKKFSRVGKKLKVLLGANIYVKAAFSPYPSKRIGQQELPAGGGFIENVPHVLQMTWLLKLTKAESQFFQFSKLLKNMAKSNMKKCLKFSTWGLVSCLQ